MCEKIRIGTWQGPVAENDVNRNLAKLYEVLEAVRDKGLDFICFPESFLSGYKPQSVTESSIPLDDPRIALLVERSAAYDTVILAGMSEIAEDGLYNTQLVIYRGQLLGAYHKTMLTDFDRLYFKTDFKLPVFEAKGIRFGIATCHTTSYVEPSLYLRWMGVRLLFTPHFNKIPPEGFEEAGRKITFWEHRTMVLNNQAALATLLKMVVVRSNVVAVDAEGLGAGDSNIWDMNGVVVAQGTPFTECIVTAEFDKGIFLEEHWIDRRELPAELCDMIAGAAREYISCSGRER